MQLAILFATLKVKNMKIRSQELKKTNVVYKLLNSIFVTVGFGAFANYYFMRMNTIFKCNRKTHPR